MSPSCLQAENISLEPQDDPLLFAQGRRLKTAVIELPERQVHRDFIDDVATQELRQAFMGTGNRETRFLELIEPVPAVIDEAEDPISKVRIGNPFGEFDGAGIGAQNQDVTQIPAPPPRPAQNTLEKNPRCEHEKQGKDEKQEQQRHFHHADRANERGETQTYGGKRRGLRDINRIGDQRGQPP